MAEQTIYMLASAFGLTKGLRRKLIARIAPHAFHQWQAQNPARLSFVYVSYEWLECPKTDCHIKGLKYASSWDRLWFRLFTWIGARHGDIALTYRNPLAGV